MSANPYAIGPSLYDWRRDEDERQSAIEDAYVTDAEDRIDYLSSLFIITDKQDKKLAERVMDEAMSEIYDSNCDHFNELLRRVWATRSKRFSNDLDRAKANMALEQIIKMLDGHIYNAMLKLVKAGEA